MRVYVCLLAVRVSLPLGLACRGWCIVTLTTGSPCGRPGLLLRSAVVLKTKIGNTEASEDEIHVTVHQFLINAKGTLGSHLEEHT